MATQGYSIVRYEYLHVYAYTSSLEDSSCAVQILWEWISYESESYTMASKFVTESATEMNVLIQGIRRNLNAWNSYIIM